MEEAGFPPALSISSMADKETVTAIIDHPDVRAISFVGSTPVARQVYAEPPPMGSGPSVRVVRGIRS